ncbi:tyrosine-type recombinase/integrase [Novosphingobium mangrovi (ex Huang et al. 2023)]|uniref:Tyrosine-type recombinase/integrase n=1 Tax=Novosphingobium mangrovi (ex Huang et al. 2023) TaxID=2976432 RepID=A0ABT2I100_9SPHN|nr:tyrosine-type recombinase/integrase [Novosphingobium mangrovi (ex Huang et al. 2023)]MCT2398483.1 tyrosine-type recombinase/integrase [Novosphingobium mangrovi (ex Huang et al. 2023)]
MGSEWKAGVAAAGVHLVKAARPGKPIRWYIYAWRGGPKIRVAEQPDRPRLTREDIAAIAAAQAHQDAPSDTVAGLSKAWQRSREWKAFAESTRTLWGAAAGKIEEKYGKVPLRVFGDPRMTPKLVKWRDELAENNGLRTADEHMKVMSMMLAWGTERGHVSCNPAVAVKRLWKGGNREEIVWTEEDCRAFDTIETVPQWLVDARRLAEFTGLRRSDLVALRWSEISDTHIARTAAKKAKGKRRRTVMPIVPGLRELLDELRTRHRNPGVDTVLVGQKGNPVQPATLSAEFNSYRSQANEGRGIIHPAEFDDEKDRSKHLHDLRGTFATKLMTLPGGSLTDDQIAMIMGWSANQVAAIRKRYVDEAAIVVAIGKRISGQL